MLSVTKDKYKLEFSSAVSSAFNLLYSDKFNSETDSNLFEPEFIYDNLEKPKDASKGRFAFPVFRYVKLLGIKPQEIAENIVKLPSLL